MLIWRKFWLWVRQIPENRNGKAEQLCWMRKKKKICPGSGRTSGEGWSEVWWLWPWGSCGRAGQRWLWGCPRCLLLWAQLPNSLQGGSQSWKIGRYRQNALWGMSTVHVDLGYLLYILRMHSLLVDFSLVIWYVCFHFHLRSYTQKYAFLYIRTQTELPKADWAWQSYNKLVSSFCASHSRNPVCWQQFTVTCMQRLLSFLSIVPVLFQQL